MPTPRPTSFSSASSAARRTRTPFLAEGPFREALEVARIAHFDSAELDLYDRAKIAEQDARGALALSRREGKAEGLAEGAAKGKAEGLAEGEAKGFAEGLRAAIKTAAMLLGIEMTANREDQLAGHNIAELEVLKEKLIRERSWPD